MKPNETTHNKKSIQFRRMVEQRRKRCKIGCGVEGQAHAVEQSLGRGTVMGLGLGAAMGNLGHGAVKGLEQ